MKAVVNCELLLYTDDSALLVSGKDVVNIESLLSEELSNVGNWHGWLITSCLYG